MIFEFVADPSFNFVASFAKKFKLPVHDDMLRIPPAMGKGTIRRIDVAPEFKFVVHRYKLHEEFILQRKAAKVPNNLVSIIFNSNENPVSLLTDVNEILFSRTSAFAIQIASTNLDSEIRFPANKEICFTVVGITAPALKGLLQLKKPHAVVDTILQESAGFVFYESMGPDIQKTLKQLTDADKDNELNVFFYRIKIQELLYALFQQLLKRETTRHSRVYKTDIDKLFVIRTAVLADLSIPPRLPRLAKMAGLSETKMKDLFKQVFGDSIYHHYQKARMEEAAFLLKQGGHTVSEIGYQLGFLNLSHFSRLFEKHYGLTPKKYASGG